MYRFLDTVTIGNIVDQHTLFDVDSAGKADSTGGSLGRVDRLKSNTI